MAGWLAGMMAGVLPLWVRKKAYKVWPRDLGQLLPPPTPIAATQHNTTAMCEFAAAAAGRSS